MVETALALVVSLCLWDSYCVKYVIAVGKGVEGHEQVVAFLRIRGPSSFRSPTGFPLSRCRKLAQRD